MYKDNQFCKTHNISKLSKYLLYSLNLNYNIIPIKPPIVE